MVSFDFCTNCQFNRNIYILDTFGRILNVSHICLYGDQRLFFIPDNNGPKTSKIQKKIIRVFRSLGLKIQISSNMKIVKFLDITFNLEDNTLKPFIKNNHIPTNINVNSNHFKSIIKQIPNAINLRMNMLSLSKTTFNKALYNSRFQHEIE